MNLFLVVLKLRRRRELSVTEPAEVPVLRSFFTNQTRVLKHVLHQPGDTGGHRYRQVWTRRCAQVSG